MLDQLKTLKPFRSLDRTALAAVERHADRLQLPEQRWLQRRGQPLTRELFLADGVVGLRSEKGTQRITSRSADGESLNALATDAAEIFTVTNVVVIAVDLAPIRSLLEGGDAASVPEVSGVDGWMNALLEGPVMRWFPPSVWARVLRAGEPRKVRQGELIVTRGEVADRVFVVGEGAAAANGRRFGSGDFFAEESALLRRPATTDTIMETDGTLIAFVPNDILDLVGEYDAPRVDAPQRLELDAVPVADEEDALAGLSPLTPVALRGGATARRLVVAAKLMRRGFTVV